MQDALFVNIVDSMMLFLGTVPLEAASIVLLIDPLTQETASKLEPESLFCNLLHSLATPRALSRKSQEKGSSIGLGA